MPRDPDASTFDLGYRRPKTRQRAHKEPPTLTAPNINEDAAERKRVLNVLAQRRYRQRKRRAKGHVTSDDVASDDSWPKPSSRNDEAPVERLDRNITTNTTSENVAPAQQEPEGPLAGEVDNLEMGSALGLDLQASWPTDSLESVIPGLYLGAEEHDLPALQVANLPAEQNTTCVLSNSKEADNLISFLPTTIDPTALIESSSTPSSSDGSATAAFSFPDTYLLPVNELTLLRGLLRIADRIKCSSSTRVITGGR